MDKKAPGAPRLQKDEEWTSMPTSTHGSYKLEAHDRTRDSIQPLDYFHTLGIGERTMSPPPVGLEKARGPPVESHPDTPAASTTSGFSRSSTINSSQTQDSEITCYSQKTSSSDDTISVPRSLSFPVTEDFLPNRNSIPKGANFPLDLPSLLNAYARAPDPKDWTSPVPLNTHLSWPQGRDEEIPVQTDQALPSRHSTFPIERSRSQTKLDGTYLYISNGSEDTTKPEVTSMTGQAPGALVTSVPEMHHNTIRQETLPDEANPQSLSVQTDTFLKGRFSASDGLVVGSFDRKHADLYCGLVSASPTEPSLHYRRRFQRYRYQRADRPAEGLIKQFGAERELSRSQNGTSISAAGELVNSEATRIPEGLRTWEDRKETDGTRESAPPSSSPESDVYHEENCEPCLPDSDDHTNCVHDASTSSNEDDEDLAYGKLLESITNLIFESSCVSNIEEKGVPVELYVHGLLEQIQNYRKPRTEAPSLCLPIRSLSKRTNEVPVGTGGPGMRPPGQSDQWTNGGGGGGNGDRNKRVRDHEDGDNPDFGSEEDHSNRHQQAKKLKMGDMGISYSCPFRKRNPTRFNVRDYSNCALSSFQTFALLKRHIQQFHKKAKGSFSCIRCKTTFEDQASLENHQLQLQGCQLREATGNGDPEDGITAEMSRALQARTRDANIGEWKPLWRLLFPNDNAAEIPDHEHEPPVELDEVQKHYYEEDSVHGFVQRQPPGQILTEHPFRYIIEGFRHCRGTPPDRHPKRRQDQDDRFQVTVRNALERRERSIFESQQSQAAPVFVPSQWAPELSDEFPFELDLDIYSNRPYPSEQPYRTHSQYGFDGVSHDPAPSTLYSSEGTAKPAPPQQPPTNFPFPTMQNGHPSLAAEGSGHRLSGLSSQRSRDSGDLRTPRTEETGETRETQNTPYTPYTQEFQYTQDPQSSQDPFQSQMHDLAFNQNQQLLHAGNARSDCQHGACSCSTSPSGKHYCTTVPDQGPSELIRGVGEGRTDAFMPGDGLVINSDEELSPSAGMP